MPLAADGRAFDLEQLLQLLPDPHVVIAADGALLAANASARQLLPPGHHSLRILATAAVVPPEFTVIVSGERRLLEAQRTLLEGPDGPRLVRLRDITPAREQEQLREQGLRVLEEIFDALPASVVVLDGTGMIIAANARWRIAAREHALLLPDDGVGTSYLDVCDATEGDEAIDARAVAAGIRDVLARRALAFEREYDMAVTGGLETFRVQVTALEGMAGAVVTHIDLSAIRNEQRAHDRALAHFQAVFEHALDAMLLLESDGTVRNANSAAAALLGLPTIGALVGRRIEDFVPPAGAPAFRVLIGDLATRGRSQVPLDLVRADGAALEVECSARAEIVPGQQLLVMRNVTEQRQLETQLRQAQKMEALGQLTGGIAHDFNNVLTVVQGNTDFLLADEGAALGEEARQALTDVLSASTRGAEMVRKLMAFARKDQLRRQPQRLDALVHDVAKLVSRLLPESIRVHVASDPDLPVAEVDASAVQQILLNLATNARDAMRGRDGELFLSLRQRPGPARDAPSAEPGATHLELRVRDTGDGMNDEVLRRVFEPFYTTKPQGEGTGLGLAMVYGLMQQHDGMVEVESAPGQGTTIVLRFPVARSPSRPAAAPAARPAPRGSEHILLVEDDRAIRTLAGRILRDAGYHVTEAESGYAARGLLELGAAQFDLVLSDVVMPDGGGTEVARAVEELQPTLAILWVTGYATDGIPRRGAQTRGRRAVLQKPWTARELLRAVRTELDAGRHATAIAR